MHLCHQNLEQCGELPCPCRPPPRDGRRDAIWLVSDAHLNQAIIHLLRPTHLLRDVNPKSQESSRGSAATLMFQTGAVHEAGFFHTECEDASTAGCAIESVVYASDPVRTTEGAHFLKPKESEREHTSSMWNAFLLMDACESRDRARGFLRAELESLQLGEDSALLNIHHERRLKIPHFRNMTPLG